MVNLTESYEGICIAADKYELIIDKTINICTLISGQSKNRLLQFGIHSSVDTPEAEETVSNLRLIKIYEGKRITVKFECNSSIWEQKVYIFECDNESVQYYCNIKGKGEHIYNLNFFMDREHFERGADAYFSKIYVPRFDWKTGKVFIDPGESDSLGCQQWFSPPPFCYALKLDQEWIGCGLAVKPGEYNFVSFDYHGGNSFYISLTYEGHTIVNSEYELPRIVFTFGSQDENEAVKGYIGWLSNNKYISITKKTIPDWWREPIFCGWGQQRHDYRIDHEGHENGNFKNAGDYSAEIIYDFYMKNMKQNGINPGTVVIDFNWSEKGALAKPSPRKWKNMRGFIDRQHREGRKILLWYTPLVADGLPEEACMTLNGKIVAADPTSPLYKKIMYEEVKKMISSEEGCLHADGFKIDFTQCLPVEKGIFTNYLSNVWGFFSDREKYIYAPFGKRKNLIRTYEEKWGVEILKEYMNIIYGRMKEIKPHSMMVAHTANPYFANVVDVLRLNDLDGTSSDITGIMSNRAEIVKICNPYWLIDTDNDLMINKDMWREYIKLQPLLGVPDTYYINAIAASCENFGEEDYELINTVWSEYRKKLK